MGKNTKKVNIKKVNLQASAKKSASSKPTTVASKSVIEVKKVMTETKPIVKEKSPESVKKLVNNSQIKSSFREQLKTEQPHKNIDNSGRNNNTNWFNIFDSAITEDFKSGIGRFMETANMSLCGTNRISGNANNFSTDLMTRFSGNIRHNFEQNIELSQSILKCKTAADFIEFQRKSFEVNYKNVSKTYNDLVHDLQNLMTQSFKDSSKYMNDSKGILS